MRILCVDTNILCYGLIRVLNELFGEVAVTSVTEIADVLALAERGERFDLVLLDARVPGVDNFEGLKHAVAAMPESPFIVTSPSENPADVLSAIRAGARGFVPMSSRLEVLRHALPLILSGEFYLPACAFRAAPAPLPTPLTPAPQMAGATTELEPLTRRQSEVLVMLASGKSNKEIARHLQLLDGTVKLHVKAILRKLGVNNRTQAVMAAARAGYLPKELLGKQ